MITGLQLNEKLPVHKKMSKICYFKILLYNLV